MKEGKVTMSVLYDRKSKQFYIRFSVKGKRVTFYTNPETGVPFGSKTEARLAEPGCFATYAPKKVAKAILCDTLFPQFHQYLTQLLKNTTTQTKWYAFKNYIIPQFTGLSVKDITNDDLENINHVLNDVIKRGSRDNAFSVAHHWIKFLRKFNPLLLPEKLFAFKDPKVYKHVYHVWTREQEAQFLSVIQDPDDKLLFTLLVDYGFRITEATALRYEDINFSRNTISVNRVACIKTGESKQVFQTPKTKTSLRTLPLVSDVLSLLPRKETGFLFPGTISTVIGENTVRKKNRKYAKLAGFKPLKIHEFRHSCASNLLRANQPIRLVARWLGDTEATISAFYSHLFGDEEDNIAVWMNENPIYSGKTDDKK
jgi:integrase